MVWRGRKALLGLPVLLLLAACGPAPAPEPTAKTPSEACDDLEDAVRAFYDIASPNSTLTVLSPRDLPELHGFTMPQPTCTFELRPDPAVNPGNVFTIENFYLHYDEELTEIIKERLEDAGYTQRDRKVLNWTATRLGTFFSASMLVFMAGDGQDYSVAADGQVLDLSISQG